MRYLPDRGLDSKVGSRSAERTIAIYLVSHSPLMIVGVLLLTYCGPAVLHNTTVHFDRHSLIYLPFSLAIGIFAGYRLGSHLWTSIEAKFAEHAKKIEAENSTPLIQ